MKSEHIIDHESSIDWQLSIKLANNNKNLAKDLLEMFMTDLPNASEKIHAAYDKQDFNELLNQVHRLHGASCYCGVTRLKELLAQMEVAVREKIHTQFEDLLNPFDEEVNNTLSAYKIADFV